MQTAIEEGWAYVTIDQQADDQGYMGIVTAVDILEGNTVEDEVFVDAKVITKDK